MRDALLVNKAELKKLYGEEIRLPTDLLYDCSATRSMDGVNKEKLEVRVVNKLGPYSIVQMTDNIDTPTAIVLSDLIVKEQVPTAMDIYSPILDKIYPNLWWYNEIEKSLFILFPEITLQNSLRHTHKITDLLIRVYVFDNGSIDALSGTRLSWTKTEYQSHFRHSHLHKGHFGQMTNFCLGTDSNFGKFMNTLYKPNSEFEFEMFLLQLREYVSWESVEGKPHISMHKIANRRVVSPDLISNGLSEVARAGLRLIAIDILETIDPAMLFRTRYTPIVMPGHQFYETVEKVMVERHRIHLPTSILLPYDELSHEYIATTQEEIPIPIDPIPFDPEIQAYITAKPGNYGFREDDTEANITLTTRLKPGAIKFLIDTINTYILQATQHTISNEQGDNV